MPDRLQLHATCVSLSGAGVLLRGAPGSGKSDLALRLIEAGGTLVADDLCEIQRQGDRLLADLPAAVDACFRGRIELRGLGFLTLAYAGATPLVLVADLQPGSKAAQAAEAPFFGIVVPAVVLDPFQASAVAKLHLLAKVGPRTIMRAP
jgi:hypothetical protein